MTDSLSTGAPRLWHVGTCIADLDRQLLLRCGVVVSLRPKAWGLLTALLRRPNALVASADLANLLWPRQEVSPKQLVNVASELRAALGGTGALRSVQRRGYVLTATPAQGPGAQAPEKPAANDAPPHFVGRGIELQALRESLARSRGGRCLVIDVMGEAGMGKSTLLAQWLAEVAHQGEWTVLKGGAVDVAGVREPFGPLIQLLQDRCRIDAYEQVAQNLRRWAPCWLAQLPGLLDASQLFQLQQEVYRSSEGRMRREGVALICHWATQRPVLLLVEDVHWADPATLDLLALLAQRAQHLPIVIITTRRLAQCGHGADFPPDHLPGAQGAEATRTITLRGFGPAELRNYVRLRAPELELHDDQVTQLIRLTDGLPLFVKAVVDELLSSRLQATDGRGIELLLGSALQQLGQFVIERVRSLDPDLKALVEVACCMAEPVPVPILAFAADAAEPGVDAACQRLVRAGLFEAHSSLAPWHGERVVRAYGLAHALYREALFAQLPASLMMALSRRIALALQTTGPVARAAYASLIRPYAQAGMHEEAAAALRMSGMRSLGRFSTRLAVQALQASLTQLQQLPERPDTLALQLETCWDLSRVMMIESSPTDDKVVAVRDLIEDLAPRVKTARSAFLLHATQCARFVYGGRADLAQVPAALLLKDSAALGKHEQALAQLWQGNVAAAQGRLADSAQAFGACLALPLDSLGLAGLDVRAIATTQLTWTLAMSGQMDGYREGAQALQDEAHTTRSAYLQILASFWLADANRQLGCFKAAQRRFTELLELCALHDSASFRDQAEMGLHACCSPEQRDLAALQALSSQRTGRRLVWSDHMLSLVTLEGMVAQGRLDDAQGMLQRTKSTDQQWPLYRAERLRLEGDLAGACGQPLRAQTLWHAALAVDIERGFLPGVLRHHQRQAFRTPGAPEVRGTTALQRLLNPLFSSNLSHPDLKPLQLARDAIQRDLSHTG